MFAAILNYKELIYFLVHKEIRIKYRNSFFGFFWSLLEPLGFTLIYTVVFSFIVRFDVENYALHVLSGLIPWMFLSNSLNNGAKSLTKNASLIRKIYFPRQIFPLSVMLANLINFIPALFLVLVVAMVTEGVGDMSFARWLVLPGIVLLQAFFVFGISVLLSAVNVFYKDVEFILTVSLRAWMYLSPIIYPLAMVPDRFFDWYMLNPMAIVLTMYRWVFFADVSVSFGHIAYVIVFAVVATWISWQVFNRLNRRVGEVI